MALHTRLMPAALALALVAAGVRQPAPARPEPVRPMPPGLAGTIVFQSDVAGRPAIYTLALATGAVTLFSGDPRWTETNPRWSPDGARVVFSSNRAHYEGATPEAGTADVDLWIVNADGSGTPAAHHRPGQRHRSVLGRPTARASSSRRTATAAATSTASASTAARRRG